MKFISIVLVISISLSQSPSEKRTKASQLFPIVSKHFKGSDFPKAIETLEEINKLRLNHSQVLYNLAYAKMMNGNAIEAFNLMMKLGKQGRVYRTKFWESEPFNKLSKKQIAALKQQFEKNAIPTKKAKITFQLEEKGLITESVAKDKAGNFYISSVRKGAIYKLDKSGKFSQFSKSTDKLAAVFSLKISGDGKHLYASSSQTKEFENYDANAKSSAAILKFDLNSAKLLERITLKNSSRAPILGDFILAKNGDIYVSDSMNNRLYKIVKGSKNFAAISPENYFNSLQGLALNKDETELFLADYSSGIFKLNLSSRTITELQSPAEIALRGTDGMYFHNGKLIAIQNGFRPNRVVEFALNKAQDAVISQKVLEVNNAIIDDPTLGTIIGNTFYFIANSQWSSIGKDGKQKAHNSLEKATVLELELK